jgi:hypothetical protein
MGRKLIRLNDQTLIEVEAPDNESVQLSSSTAEKVAATFESIRPLLIKVCTPIAAAWKELLRDVEVDGAEVQLSFGFEAEGNVFLARTKGSGNVDVKVSFRPLNSE